MINPVFILGILIISPDESHGFIGLMLVAFPCVCNNSKRMKIFLPNLVHMLRIAKGSLFSGVLKLPRFMDFKATLKKENIAP